MTVTVLTGDCLAMLRTLDTESVHCVVTSPPYFGLRDYGTQPSIWGGDAACEHEWGEPQRTPWANSVPGPSARQGGPAAGKNGDGRRNESKWTGPACINCGAWRGELGQEPSLAGYLDHCQAVFREVRRVLRDDGTLWLNLGDSYAGSWGAQGHRITDSDDPSWHGSQIKNHPRLPRNTGAIKHAGLKPKDLMGIPWRVAFALQEDGWYLRSDIIWHKPNPMPESIKDRPTKAHEYLFMLAKSERYYFDAQAVREPSVSTEPAGNGFVGRQGGSDRVGPLNGGVGSTEPWQPNATGRNIRSVWSVPTSPFPGAHFATFPPALIEPCIKAGCPVGGIVLDPFGGAGTTGLVADRLGRDAILIELNPEYADMARRRIRDDAPLLDAMGAA